MEPLFLIVDLFCGAGGTTTGFAQAELEGNNIAKVIACVNHDPLAIKSHWLNHPEVLHFEEDIRTLELAELIKMVSWWQERYPDAYLVLWASLECTNFSKAKGGQPRDADSRTLADHLHRYITAINPDYVQIENVVEFMSWGPLDENGKPISRKNGSEWMRWRSEMCEHGYYDEWSELNSANFGAYTSRNRLFGCFAKHGLPIIWPEPTHSKKAVTGSLFDSSLKKWKPVKDVLDFSDEGISIFNRKKDLSPKTLERIYAGLVKYVAKGDLSFISKYYSGRPSGKVNSINDPSSTLTTLDNSALVNIEPFISNYKSGHPESKNSSITDPIGTLTTIPTQSVIVPVSLLKYNSTDNKGNHYPPSIEEPSPVLTTQNRIGMVQAEFIVTSNGGIPSSKVYNVHAPSRVITTKDNQSIVFLQHYYGNGFQTSMDEPAPTITTKDRSGIVKPEFFLDKHFGAAQNQSIDQPAGVVMPNDKHRLVEAVPFIMPTHFDNKPKSIEEPAPTLTASRRHHYLVNPSWGGNPGSVDNPCPVIVARQDKVPLYLMQIEEGEIAIPVYDTDCDVLIKIKQFMLVFRISDIKMRMLRVNELLKIQGFPSDYNLSGNQSDQKKFIGNSVVPHVVKAWCEAMGRIIIKKLKAA